MSELKVYHCNEWHNEYTEFYMKSEADKVIAYKDAEIERLEILCATYRHDCDNLAISNDQAKRAERTLLKKMNYNKYKRCLAMARRCFTKSNYHFVLARHGEDVKKNNRKSILYSRWNKRWLAIAAKYEEVSKC